MYLGWWLIHLGVGVLRGSAWVAATVPVAVLVEHFGGSVVEERELRRQFGAEYAVRRAGAAYVRRPGGGGPARLLRDGVA